MSRRYDVLIVGAGPAGTSAAYHAARAGLRTLIIDRVPFPRDKTCGDVLMPEAVASLARIGVTREIGCEVRGARFVHVPTGDAVEEDFDARHTPGYALAVERKKLDFELLRRAIEAGAVFDVGRVDRTLDGRPGECFGLEYQSQTQGVRRVRGRVIAATGAVTPHVFHARAPRIRCSPRCIGFAARGYLRSPNWTGDRLEMYFPMYFQGRTLAGYGWVFPVRPGLVNIGAGIMRASGGIRVPIRQLALNFVAWRLRLDPRLKNAEPAGPIRAWPLPLDPIHPSAAGILFVGDAAGFANPFTGEGIGVALDTGELAARAVITGGCDPTTVYSVLLSKRFPAVRRFWALADDVYRKSEFFLGSGYDLLLRPTRLPGSLVRSMLWGAPSGPPWWESLSSKRARRAITAAASTLTAYAMRTGTTSAAFVRELAEARRLRFGRVTGLGMVLSEAIEGSLSEDAVRSLLVLDLVMLVRELLADLPDSGVDGRSHSDWGCDTIVLASADIVNALALKQLSLLPETSIRELTEVCRDMLQVVPTQCTRGQFAYATGRELDCVVYQVAARIALTQEQFARFGPLLRAVLTDLDGGTLGRRSLEQLGRLPASMSTALLRFASAVGASVDDRLTASPSPTDATGIHTHAASWR